MKHRIWLVALSLAALSVGAAPAQIKIGLTVSASGPGAALGQPQSKTVAILPKKIAGEDVEYILLDDESNPTKGAQNVRKLISEDNIDALIGSSLTPVSLPLIDIVSEAKLPTLTLSASQALVKPMDDKKKWIFKAPPNDDLMAQAILDYIAKSGIKKLGYIGVSDGYGEGYYNFLKTAAPNAGVELTTHEVYSRTDASVTGQVLKVLATRPDAVFIASAGTPGVLPQKALRERGYKGTIFQTHGIATNEFIKLGGKDVEGAIFTGEVFTVYTDLPADSPFRAVPTQYVEAYKAVYHEDPPIFGAHVWDSVTLLQNAIPTALKAGKPGTEAFRVALRDALENGKQIYLNNGLSTMSPTDHNGYDSRSATLIKIEDGKFRLLK